MRRLLVTLFAAAVLGCAAGAGPATASPSCAIDENGNCVAACDLYDANCALADSGYFDTTVSSDADTTGYDLYGYGGICRWVAIRDTYYQYPFGTKSWVGVLQAYVCRRNGQVTRFDQVSAFASQLFGFPWNTAYHLVWSLQQAPTTPSVPTWGTSTTAVLAAQVCAWFTPVCSNPKYPRYVIQATGSGFSCYVDGQYYAGCVGHRYR